MTIPPRLHFCWIGSVLPWAYVFAVLSAAARSGLPEIILHHTDILEEGDTLSALRNAAGVSLSRLDPIDCLSAAGSRLGLGDRLVGLYRRLDDPVKRSDVLRAAILYGMGGIYADLDTVTVASLRPLLDNVAFVGAEVIVWPPAVRASRSPVLFGRHLALDLLRKVFRWLPGGWKAFRQLERYYVRSINNAVMGAEGGSQLMAAYLRAMVELAPERQNAPYALGPHLLCDVVAGLAPEQVVVQDPELFYPLPPEISEHWFRRVRSADLERALSVETRIVHWYASVRTRSRVALIDPAYVRRNRDRQLYSALVCSCIPELIPAA